MDTFWHVLRTIRFWFTTRAGREQELCAAARKGNADEVRFLLSCGVRVDGGDVTGVLAMQYAVESGSREVVGLLLAAGVRVDAKGFRGWQPLHYAARDGHRSVAELLIEKGAKADAKDQDDTCPLHIAAEQGKTEMAMMLVEKGAPVCAADREGRQPLHHAALQGQKDVVAALIENGAQVDAEDRHGNQPLHFAASRRMASHMGSFEITAIPFLKEHGAVISLLLAHEADPTAVNKAGKTPRALCQDRENMDLLEKAEREWQSPLRNGRKCQELSEHLRRQRKLGSLRPKGPSL